MAIDIQTEQVVGLAEASRIIPPRNGRRVAVSTLWRWCRKGIGGVRLEYIRLGRNIATSTEALNRFFRALARNDSDNAAPPTSTEIARSIAAPERSLPEAARRASLEQADRILERAGI